MDIKIEEVVDFIKERKPRLYYKTLGPNITYQIAELIKMFTEEKLETKQPTKKKCKPHRPNRGNKNNLEDDLKKFNGLPPYDGGSNYVKFDGYFGADIAKRYSKENIDRCMKDVIDPMKAKIEAFKRSL